MMVQSLWRGAINRKITMAEIICETAEDHGLTPKDLKGDDLRRHVCRARQDAMWRMRREGRWSTTQIGRALGGRDHTTVLHGLMRHQSRMLPTGSAGDRWFVRLSPVPEMDQNQDGSGRRANASPVLTSAT